jgi:hypothetical protein
MSLAEFKMPVDHGRFSSGGEGGNRKVSPMHLKVCSPFALRIRGKSLGAHG